MMIKVENNPWSVRKWEEFLYFCCPECDVKNHSRDHFLKHAFDQHPKSKECLEKLASSVKKEEIMNDCQEGDEKNQKFIKDNEFEQSMKEEKLDEESDDPNMYLNSNYIE